MKILYVTDSMGVGGVETNLVGLTGHLSCRGHEVVVASSGGDLVGELEAAGGRHIRLGISLRSPRALFQASQAIRSLLLQEPFDVVHTMSAAGNAATWLAPRRGHRRPVFVSSPMGLQNSDHEAAFITDIRNRLLAARVDRVLAISEEIRGSLEHIRVAPDRLINCHLVGIEPHRFVAGPEASAKLRAELGIDASQSVITTIGALHPRKSHHLFVAAAAEALKEHPEARFLIIGAGDLASELSAQTRRLGIEGRVLLTGNRRDIGAVLGMTDVYVKPGVVEGFIGITVLEAMAAGTPVVAFNTNDVQAAIEDGKTGLLVPRGDHRKMAQAILELLNNRQLARTLADNGRNLVNERFSLSQIAVSLESLYLRLSAELSAGPES